jgi:hypothetical protein
VVIRSALVSRTARAGADAGPLGFMGLDDLGDPAGRLEVSLEGVTDTISGAEYLDRTVSALPGPVHEYLVGRALGRVMAHEIGHWLR